MDRLLKDRYFWYIVALVVFLGILTYVAEAAVLGWLPALGEWHLVYMAFQRVLFLVTVAIAAWRFGVGGGLTACLAIGLVVLPHAVDEAVSQWRPDLLVELWIVATVGIVLSWLIGTRRQAEKVLRDSEKRYRMLFESAGDAIFILDAEGEKAGQIVVANRAAAEMHGYTSNELLALRITDLDTLDAAKEAPGRIRRMLNGEWIKTEITHRKKDGTVFPVEISAGLLELGGHKYILAFDRDITERKQAEEALKESEERFKAIFNNATDGILVAGIETQKFYTGNKMISQMLGYSLEEVKNLGIMDIHPKEDLPYVLEQFEKQARREIILAKDIPVKRKDGSVFYADINSFPLTLAGKKCLAGIFRDITERKQAEDKLQKLYQQEKNLRRQLEEQMRQRVEFTRALVHELKTPLTPVLGASALLVTQLKEEPWLSLAKNISRGANNLNRRIDELFDLARGEIGMLRLRCKWVDPLQLLHEVVDYAAPEATMNRQTLIADLSTSIPQVWVDDDRLRQVILNLLNNAFKFTPKGGKITLKARKKGDNMIVAVQDTGRGMNKEEQRRLFQPYYRVESEREHLSGLGLGLALSKVLVELHGGEIWVKSQKGKGSTFSFSVPLKAAVRGKGN